MNLIEIKSPAKLNLHLQVLNRRLDGFHNISSLFTLIDITDGMSFKRTDKYIDLVESTPIKDNIVQKAAMLLKENYGVSKGVTINLSKSIPDQKGLGGGSSNAAGALIGVNALLELGLSSKDLIKIGKKLGADVPFFIFGKNAHASGTGDVLLEAKSSSKKFLLLFPQIHSSTKELFHQWDRLSKDSQNRIIKKEENSFLPLFLQNNQDIKESFNQLNDLCSLRLSGTGSTMFFMYENKDEIEKTLKKIPSKWRHSFCEPLQCSPLLTYLT